MIANFAATEIRPGSMGRPLPGIDATMLVRGEDGPALVQEDRVREVTNPGDVGELAVRADRPSMFRGFLNDEARFFAASPAAGISPAIWHPAISTGFVVRRSGR
jgi:acetyl-CoA synthetase